MIDVLPAALARASSFVRAGAGQLEPTPVSTAGLSDPRLAGAVEAFSAAWSISLGALADETLASAWRLQASAELYAAVEDLLVPRSLR